MTRTLLLILLVTAALVTSPPAGGADTPDEVGFVDPTTGLWDLGADESFYFGVPGDVPFLGDWDGDGIDTPGLYRPSEGFAYVINRRETGVADDSWFMGIPGDIPIVGDWDGDGDDTFSIYRPSEGKVYINNLAATSVAQVEYYFGVPADKPFAIDFDADGIDDVGLHRESTGLVYMTDARTAGVFDGEVAVTDLEFFWGVPRDAVFAGDWNGTGLDTPGLVRPLLGRAFLRFENTLGPADEDWPIPASGRLPVVGRIAGAPARFQVELSGAEVQPGPGQPGAAASVGLNVTAGGELCFSFETGAVTGVTGAHVHAGAAGASGPVVVDLGLAAGTPFGCVTADPSTAVALLDRPEDFYVQIHSTAYPAGAVRGQLAETRGWDLALVGAAVAGGGDADGFVMLSMEVSTSGRACLSSFASERVSTITSIGLYAGAPGETGARLADLTFGPAHTGCTVLSPPAGAARVLADPSGHYVQVGTIQFPGGAVRAQLSTG